MRGRGEWDEDVVDRTKASGTTDPLALELMQEVVYLRNEVAKLMRVVNTPFTYRVVNFLKRVEHEDYYDRDTNFTPFSVRV